MLEEQARTRVPELVPIRYGRMLLSPLAFFRGAAAIMAADLAPTPRTGLAVQLSGDAHLSNFGVFAASDRRLVFSLNDFDETLPGPFEWDVKRLVASFEVAGRERGLDRRSSGRAANLTAVRSYRLALQGYAQSRTLDVWYARLEVDAIVQQWTTEVRAKRLDRVKRNLAKRTVKDNLRALDKLTEVVDGKRRIVSDPPLIVPLEELALGRGERAVGRGAPRDLQVVPAHAPDRPPAASGPFPLHPGRAQGRRRRQRGHADVDRPAARP